MTVSTHTFSHSGHVAAASYDDVGQVLTIEFSDGGRYGYANAPRSLYDGLVESVSPGSYFHRQIKGRYIHAKLG